MNYIALQYKQTNIIKNEVLLFICNLFLRIHNLRRKVELFQKTHLHTVRSNNFNQNIFFSNANVAKKNHHVDIYKAFSFVPPPVFGYL